MELFHLKRADPFWQASVLRGAGDLDLGEIGTLFLCSSHPDPCGKLLLIAVRVHNKLQS